MESNRLFLLTKRTDNNNKLPLTKKLSIDTKNLAGHPVPSAPKSAKHSNGSNLANFRFKQYQRQANNLRNSHIQTIVPTPKGAGNPAITVKKPMTRSIAAAASLEATTIENWVADNKNTTRNSIQDPLKGNIYFLNSTLTNQPISVNINISNQINQIGHLEALNPSATPSHATVRLKEKNRSNNISISSVNRQRKERTPKRSSIQCRIKYANLQTRKVAVPPIATTERTKAGEKAVPASLGATIIASPKKSLTLSKPLIGESPRNSAMEDTPKFPMTAAQALKAFADKLDDYEKGEILDYKEIYYVNPRKGRKNGYDDDKGDYNACMGDHIAYRYEIIGILGKGSFGQALRCVDHKTKQQIAVKIIRSKKRFYRQALVEVKVLKYIKDHDLKGNSNVIKMFDYFTFRKHICITFELLSINLYDFLKENNFRSLSLGLIRRFAVQMLESLCFLKSHSIIHCDLKPENILLKTHNKSEVKLIDFGSSCFSNERIYTYIQSRFYRAPEIMFAIPYTTGIDMWSLGCILVELHTGIPLFPGENEPEQLALIMEVNGYPPATMLNKATRRHVFFDDLGAPLHAKEFRGRIKPPGTKPLSKAIESEDPDFIDFIRQCLIWEPEKRITPEAALSHRWIKKGLPGNAAPYYQTLQLKTGPEPTVKVEPEILLNKTKNRIAEPIKKSETLQDKLAQLKQRLKQFSIQKSGGASIVPTTVDKKVFNRTILVNEGGSRNNVSLVDSAVKSKLKNSVIS